MAENIARTLSPIIGAAVADKYHRFKLIGLIGYALGSVTACFAENFENSKIFVRFFRSGQ